MIENNKQLLEQARREAEAATAKAKAAIRYAQILYLVYTDR